jgi:hypothetical protein
MMELLDFIINLLTVSDDDNYKKENNENWKITILTLFCLFFIIILIEREKIFLVNNIFSLLSITYFVSLIFGALTLFFLHKINLLKQLIILEFILYLTIFVLIYSIILLEINYNLKLIE